MQTILVPKDFFDWMVSCAEPDSRYGAHSVGGIFYEFCWRDKIRFRVNNRVNIKAIMDDPEMREQLMQDFHKSVNVIGKWD